MTTTTNEKELVLEALSQDGQRWIEASPPAYATIRNAVKNKGYTVEEACIEYYSGKVREVSK